VHNNKGKIAMQMALSLFCAHQNWFALPHTKRVGFNMHQKRNNNMSCKLLTNVHQ